MKIGALFHVDGRSTKSLAQRMAKAQRGTLYTGTSGFDIHFQWIRLRCSDPYRRYTSAIARHLGYVDRHRWWDEAPLIERVIGRVEDDPRLHAENLKATKAGQFPRGFANECRAILFYWQMWKWIMDDRIRLVPTELRQSLGLFSVRARQTSATESGVAL